MIKPGDQLKRNRGGGEVIPEKPTWDALRVEAADWLAAMDTGEVSRNEFEKWRNADPRHAAAFAQVANSLMTMDRVKPDLKTRVPAVRAMSRRLLIQAGAGVFVGAVAVGGFAVATAKSTLVTNVGERKTHALPGDGILQLNTASKVQYRSHSGVTEIWLREGELALDLSRGGGLCRLYAADRIAEFSGAVVNARLRGNLVDLAVVSGSCTLKPATSHTAQKAAPHAATVVRANHAILSGANESIVRPLNDVDTAFLTGWPKGELIFEGQTLETAITEYNRYLPNKIVIADASLSSIRLGGRFTTRDPAAFLQALHEGFGIRATDDGEGNVTLTK
jgi:transmembrane sensor